MCYPVCGVMHIKEPLLLIGKSSHVVMASGFLSEWFFTIIIIRTIQCIIQICLSLQTDNNLKNSLFSVLFRHLSLEIDNVRTIHSVYYLDVSISRNR